LLEARAIFDAGLDRPPLRAKIVHLEPRGNELMESGIVHISAELLELVPVDLDREIIPILGVDGVTGVHEVPIAAHGAAGSEERCGKGHGCSWRHAPILSTATDAGLRKIKLAGYELAN
jgi:hypothetical protein